MAQLGCHLAAPRRFTQGDRFLPVSLVVNVFDLFIYIYLYVFKYWEYLYILCSICDKVYIEYPSLMSSSLKILDPFEHSAQKR